jgi:hypothetical protein
MQIKKNEFCSSWGLNLGLQMQSAQPRQIDPHIGIMVKTPRPI